jgi:hypothetical protein
MQALPDYAKLLHAVLIRHDGLLRNQSTWDLAYANSLEKQGLELKNLLWRTSVPFISNDVYLETSKAGWTLLQCVVEVTEASEILL